MRSKGVNENLKCPYCESENVVVLESFGEFKRIRCCNLKCWKMFVEIKGVIRKLDY
jgi:transposase-like protein